jgi:hypothetical protein
VSIDEARDIRKYNTFENGTKHFDQWVHLNTT